MASRLSYFKKILINFLKGEAIKLALKNILGSAVMGGPKAWLIKFIVTELFEELGEPIIKAALNKIGYYYDKIDGNINIGKIKEARARDDKKAYNEATDNILSR
jgi:hypothetical protein